MTILQDDIPMWRTLRGFLLAGGSPAFPKVRSFMQKYGATDCNAFYRLQGVQEPREGLDAAKVANLGPGDAMPLVEMMRTMGMLDKKPDVRPDPLDSCPF